jgi:hypothetical protein
VRANILNVSLNHRARHSNVWKSINKKGKSMTKQTIRVLTILLMALLLQSGCATVRTSPAANKTPVVVKELAKTTKSWDGACMPPYPQAQPEVTIRRISIPEGTRLDMHSHAVINAGMLFRLSGQGTGTGFSVFGLGEGIQRTVRRVNDDVAPTRGKTTV